MTCLRTILFFLVFLTLFGCQKKQVADPPLVEFISPTENELIVLPEIIKVHLKVNATEPIVSIEIRIVNEANVPLFEPVKSYPGQAEFELKKDLTLGMIPNGQFSPFYIQIVITDNSGTHSYYQPVKFVNPDLEYKGFYLSTRPSMQETSVYFYDNELNEKLFIKTNGEYRQSGVGDEDDLFYLSTTLPSKLDVYEFEDEQLAWSFEPELPIPEITDIHCANGKMFIATANGRIRSFTAFSGISDAITHQMIDSVPGKISTSEKYIIGDFLSQSGNGNAIAVFYKSTGFKLHTYPLNIRINNLFSGENIDDFIVFGNTANKGAKLSYFPSLNVTANLYYIDEGNIEFVERINNEVFIMLINDAVYLFNIQNNIISKLLEFDENLVAIAYNQLNAILFIAFADRVEIFSYPGLEKLLTQMSPSPVKGLDIRYGYE